MSPPQKPLEDILATKEEQIYADISYKAEQTYYTKKLGYYSLVGLISVIPLGIGLKRDKKAIIEYFQNKSEEYNRKR